MDFLVADRTFSSMENIIKNFKFGGILHFFYKLLLFDNSENTENFIKANVPKIILCDPQDNLVVELSSLKSSISNKYVNNKFKPLNKKNKKNSILLYCLEDKENVRNFIEILYLLQNGLNKKNKEKILKKIKLYFKKFQKNLLKKNGKKNIEEFSNKNVILIYLS